MGAERIAIVLNDFQNQVWLESKKNVSKTKKKLLSLGKKKSVLNSLCHNFMLSSVTFFFS